MVKTTRVLIRSVWNLAFFVAAILVARWLSLDMPAWLTFALIGAALGAQIWYLRRSDQKTTTLANQAALARRMRTLWEGYDADPSYSTATTLRRDSSDSAAGVVDSQ